MAQRYRSFSKQKRKIRYFFNILFDSKKEFFLSKNYKTERGTTYRTKAEKLGKELRLCFIKKTSTI